MHKQRKHSFGSDNHSGIHPEILKAIISANSGHVPAYGEDLLTASSKDRICELFGREADIYFVFNGTGANVLALRSVTRPYNAIICTDTAHIWQNECGAPEFHTGCKLIAIPTPDGKLKPDMIEPHLHTFGSPHSNQPKVISITQPTEMGTLYSVKEISELAELAHSHNMYLHVDGTRLANAVAATGIGPAEMIADSGVDILSFGGTKNGMLMGESVVFFDSTLSENAKYERKQLMQLSSKMRFISAQFEAYLENGLWIELGSRANHMAALLESRLKELPEIEILYKVETNGVFVRIPYEIIDNLKREGYYNGNESDPCQVRWMCSFDTTEEDIIGLIEVLKNITQPKGTS